MQSRLSSLLVRDGLVGVKRIEKAFQRQVIYGGNLDTILLEMNLISEERLTQYLSLAFGVPPASRDEATKIEAAAVQALTDEISLQFRAVPLTIDGEALRILVCAPLDIAELEDLADLLDRPLQPLITPEYRWYLAYADAYHRDPPSRFSTLARTLEIESGATPVGRARSIIVDEKSVDVALPHTHTTAPPPSPVSSHAPATSPSVPTATAPTPSPIIATPPPSHTTAIPAPDHATTTRPPNQGIATIPSVSGEDSTYLALPMQATAIDNRLEPSGDSHRSSRTTNRGFALTARPPGAPQATVDDATGSGGQPPPKTAASPRSPARVTQPIATTGRDSPLPIARARELIAAAEDRDSVFLTLLRAARARARYAALLTIQGGAAIGRVALAEPGIDTAAVANVLIPLDAVSPFRSVVNNQQPHIGPLTGEDSIAPMIARLGGSVPPSALILPIVLRDRVVAIVVAHRGHSELKLVDVAELFPLAAAVADALGRLIVKHKTEAASERSDKMAAAQAETAKHRQPAAPGGHAALAPAEEVRSTAANLTPQEPPRPIEQIFDEIEAAKPGEAESAIAAALDRTDETIGALMRRFPGHLRIDRFAASGRSLTAAQYGGLLELVVRLGPMASELVIDKMSAPQRDVRFYATICAVELRPRGATTALVERLFDQDAGVRAAAIDALAGYARHERSQSLARARRAVHSTDPEIVAKAAAAIVALGDTESIGDLIGSLARADQSSHHVRSALVALTAQDFGLSEKRWRKWWAAARRKHRIAWLIEGLVHRDDSIRANAIHELRRLTGEYFGYHHDLPRKERDAAAEQWNTWWRDVGMRRFGITEVE